MNKLPTFQDVQDASERMKACNGEQKQYFAIARDKYPDNTKIILRLNYSNGEKYDCIAECAYILEHQAMPEWGYVIERFEILPDGNTLFIHRDKSEAQ